MARKKAAAKVATRKKTFVPTLPEDVGPTSRELEIDRQIEAAKTAYVKRLCQENSGDAVRSLLEIATNTRRKPKPNEDYVFEVEEGEPPDYAPGPRVAAARALLEHGLGRPIQQINHAGDRGGVSLTIVCQQLGDGKTFVKDVTPARERIEEGDLPSEQLAAS